MTKRNDTEQGQGDPTYRDVAKWMYEQLKEREFLYQEDAASDIEQEFGDEFVYQNENGNFAIDKQVLKEFRKLTERKVVWDRYERMWRFREDTDPPGRQVE